MSAIKNAKIVVNDQEIELTEKELINLSACLIVGTVLAASNQQLEQLTIISGLSSKVIEVLKKIDASLVG